MDLYGKVGGPGAERGARARPAPSSPRARTENNEARSSRAVKTSERWTPACSRATRSRKALGDGVRRRVGSPFATGVSPENPPLLPNPTE
uniref:RAB3C, member RAS oncogene family n=1 Tax=Myotis myotis TaxID=51298 RepID=A0A7J7Y2G5_MYOMY|nr:RAB3C, member RAS oncogene family [Myotis myotis]